MARAGLRGKRQRANSNCSKRNASSKRNLPRYFESNRREPLLMELLQELLTEELKDLLSAENQLVKALPKMVRAAKDADLKKAIEEHLEQTKGHVERLKQVFELMEEKPRAKACKGMAGLVEEGQEVITEGKQKDETAADLALIGAAQRVEHYEIAAYGTARAIAEQMERRDIVKLLSQTLAEEEKADQLLSQVAQPLLEQAGQEPEEEEVEEEEMEEEEV
jgi:Mn-containing catalase